MRGTAGQTGLNQMDTTIKCPTRLSHFRDRWDTTGGNATVKERAPTWANDYVLETDSVRARSLTVAFPPVNFSGTLGHGTKLGPVGTAHDLKTCQINPHNLASKVIPAPAVNC